jgi:uncharacterized membrane protein
VIYFIHHTAEAIQVNNVIQQISNDLSKTIKQLYPDRHSDSDGEIRDPDGKNRLPPNFDDKLSTVTASISGYVQTFDPEGLFETAMKNDLIIRLLRRPGHFLVPGTPLAEVFPAEAVDDPIAASITLCANMSETPTH